MSLDADSIVDRRRLRRKLTFWRVSALIILLMAAVGAGIWLAPSGRFTPRSDSIARIRIQGLIRDNRDRVEALDRLAKSRVKAVIVHIDSPGGTTAGSQQLYDSLRSLQAKHDLAYLFISHDLKVIRALANDVIVMRNGKIVEAGPSEQIFGNPQTDYTRALISAAFKIETAPVGIVSQ